MNELLELLKMPIPSLAGLMLLWIVAERAGLPITKIFSSLLKLNGKKENGVPEGAQELKEHFNDETSIILKEIRDGVKKLDERGETACKKMDKVVSLLEDSKENDIEWRRESREFMRDVIKR